MSDVVEMLRAFIADLVADRGKTPSRPEALVALDWLVAERDALRKALDDRFDADVKATKALFAATGRTRGFSSAKETVAYCIAEMERLERELAGARETHIAQLAVHAALQLKYAMLLERSEDQQ